MIFNIILCLLKKFKGKNKYVFTKFAILIFLFILPGFFCFCFFPMNSNCSLVPSQYFNTVLFPSFSLLLLSNILHVYMLSYQQDSYMHTVLCNYVLNWLKQGEEICNYSVTITWIIIFTSSSGLFIDSKYCLLLLASALITTFNIYCNGALLAINSLSFVYLGRFYFTFLFIGSLLDIRFLVDFFFSFSTLNMSFHFFLVCIIYWQISCYSYWGLPNTMYHFSLSSFKMFSLSLTLAILLWFIWV